MRVRLPVRLVLRLAGISLGYGTPLLTTLGWFLWTHHTPTDAASGRYMAATAVFSLAFAFAGGRLATAIAGSATAAYAVALLILFSSVWAFILTHSAAAGHDARWWLTLSILCIAPAAGLGGSRFPPERR